MMKKGELKKIGTQLMRLLDAGEEFMAAASKLGLDRVQAQNAYRAMIPGITDQPSVGTGVKFGSYHSISPDRLPSITNSDPVRGYAY